MRRTVLVVDVQPGSREVISDCLRHGGYEVFASETCDDGFNQFRRFRPDLVIADAHLQEESGVEFCRRIRYLREVPFILLTSDGEIEQSHESGKPPDGLLEKPVALNVLLSCVETIMGRRLDQISSALKFGS